MAQNINTVTISQTLTDEDYIIGSVDNKLRRVPTSFFANAVDSRIGELENDTNVLNARMNTFTTLKDGSTTGDAEMTDIRVGYDGTLYDTAGDAVRSQISNLNSDLSNLLFSYSYSKGEPPSYDIKHCNFATGNKLIFDVKGAKCNILAVDANDENFVLKVDVVEGRHEITLSKDIKALGLFVHNFEDNPSLTEITVFGAILGDVVKELAYCKDKVNALNNFIHYGKTLFMGDSITANNSWIPTFVGLLGITEYTNIAVSSAKVRDYSDTVYDGNPIYTQYTNNVLGNQVEKIIRGKDSSHTNYSRVADYDNFDMIIISCGTNDLSYEDVSTIESQFIVDKQVVPLYEVDRKTFAGAMRYCYEKLHNLYPKAQIFFCTPIQESYGGETYQSIRDKGNLIKAITDRLSVDCIDTFKCGICGIYNNPGANGEDLMDGLHPNTNGAMKIARYNAKKVSEKRWITN